MTLDFQRPRVLAVGMLLLLGLLALVVAWAIEAPRRPFEYMVAGSFAAAIVLTLLYLLAVRRRLLRGLTLRIPRRSERSS